MRRIIEENTIGLVATVTPDGFPRVSPKGTMRVLGETRIGFADLRSPETVRNIAANPSVEVSFIDVFRRQGCRLRGTARYHARPSDGYRELAPQFETWGALMERARGIVTVDVSEARLLRSPIYDIGAHEADLVRQWLATYTRLHGDGRT